VRKAAGFRGQLELHFPNSTTVVVAVFNDDDDDDEIHNFVFAKNWLLR
jgi:hypothetical protein